MLLTTGLGTTDPSVPSGQVTPSEPVSTVVKPLRVTIEGTEAEVVSAVLEPGIVGVYRVSIKAPERLKASSSALVVVESDGVASAPVTVAVGETEADRTP